MQNCCSDSGSPMALLEDVEDAIVGVTYVGFSLGIVIGGAVQDLTDSTCEIEFLDLSRSSAEDWLDVAVMDFKPTNGNSGIAYVDGDGSPSVPVRGFPWLMQLVPQVLDLTPGAYALRPRFQIPQAFGDDLILKPVWGTMRVFP